MAKQWNQPSCPTTNDWKKKTWRVYTIEYYSVIKKNVIVPSAGKWVEIILSEISKAQKAKYHAFGHTQNLSIK
jgi:hypothetical protein